MKATTLTVLRILGVLTAIGGGSAAFLAGTWASLTFSSGAGLLALALVSAVVGAVCGWLLRTWWALLAVLVLFDIGLAATIALLNYGTGGLGPGVRGPIPSFLLAMALLVLYLPLPFVLVVVGTALGTGVGKWMDDQRMSRRRGQ